MQIVSTLVALMASFDPILTSRTADNVRMLLHS